MAVTASKRKGFMTAREVESTYGMDLITAETLRAGLIEVTRHMKNSLMRSGFSNVVRELLDFGVGVHLIQPEGTELVAITEGCCHFAFTHQHMTNMVLDEWGLDNLGPGDTVFSNDSWRGSIHFPDVNLFRPIFWQGELAFILTDASHVQDIGGPMPGGFNNQATTFFEEGLRVPPTLITSADKPVRSTINLLLENTRLPLHMLGDLRALFGTLKVGEARLTLLLERYGLDAVRAACRYTLDLAERRMRLSIEQIPDGLYEAEEVLDDDGRGGEPIRIRAGARVKGSSVEIDFSGSDRQPLGATTTCWEETNRCLIGAKMILDAQHPMNAGAMRPFHIVMPPGTVTMGLPPTSQSQHPEVGAKICNLALELFGKMMPDRAIAKESGTSHVIIAGGADNRPGRGGLPYGTVVAAGAAWGGTHSNDGISFNITAIYNISDNVIEFLERDTPLVVRSRNLLMDAAGAGKYRSGYSNACVVESLAGPAFCTTILDSGRFPRRGIFGGGAGMTSFVFKARQMDDRTIRHRNGIVPLSDLTLLAGRFDTAGAPDSENGQWGLGAEFATVKLSNYMLPPGEVLYVIGATGGGYGNPLDRDAELVRLDVWNEKLSPEFAERAYGVVLDRATLKVDQAATRELRETLHQKQAREEWKVPIGCFWPWPKTWEELLGSSACGTGRRASAGVS